MQKVKLTIIILLLILHGILRVNAVELNMNTSKSLNLGESPKDIVIIKMDIHPKAGESIMSFQMDIDYDKSDLELEEIVLSTESKELLKELNYREIEPGKVRVLVYGIEQREFSGMGVFEIRLRKQNPDEDKESVIQISGVKVSDPVGEMAEVVKSVEKVVLQLKAIYADLGEMKVYPNPYKPSKGHATVKFANITEEKAIKIYTLTGELVRDINEVSGSVYEWDTRNESGEELASGIYLYLVTSGSGEKETGRIVIVR